MTTTTKATSVTTTSLTTKTSTTTSTTVAASTATWSLVDNYSGSTFFDNWNFFDYADPTNGYVDYLSKADAVAANLTYVNSAGQAVTAVDSTNDYANGTNRPSVRLQSKKSYATGLVLWDIEHMPVGCAVWPALWSNGPGTWPAGGEIDLLEGVGDSVINTISVHTGTGCNMDQMNTTSTAYTGSMVEHGSCSPYSDEGCSFESGNTKNPRYGSQVNEAGGGIYAVRFDPTQITAWFLPRASIPADVTAGKPTPDSTWPRPMGQFLLDNCPYSSNFGNQTLITTMTLCGDWAGSADVWGKSWTNAPEANCAGTCQERVMTGSNFADAYFTFNSVKIYQQLS